MKKLYVDQNNNHVGIDFEKVIAFHVAQELKIDGADYYVYEYLAIVMNGSIGEKPFENNLLFSRRLKYSNQKEFYFGKQIHDDLIHYFQSKIDCQNSK